jgi:hypothetical protein
VGDIVKTKNKNYIGTISSIHNTCPMSNNWLSNQSIPVLAESVRSTWYSIKMAEGGVVCCPKCDVKLFYNIYDEE